MKEAPNIADIELAAASLVGGLRDSDGLVAAIENGLRLPPKCLAGLGQTHGTPISFEQQHTHFIFQLPDLTAQRGLRHAKFLRRLREAELARDSDEVAQVPKFHARHDSGKLSLCELRSIGAAIRSQVNIVRI